MFPSAFIPLYFPSYSFLTFTLTIAPLQHPACCMHHSNLVENQYGIIVEFVWNLKNRTYNMPCYFYTGFHMHLEAILISPALLSSTNDLKTNLQSNPVRSAKFPALSGSSVDFIIIKTSSLSLSITYFYQAHMPAADNQFLSAFPVSSNSFQLLFRQHPIRGILSYF